MATDSIVLTADFPKAVRGYAPAAVDEFIRAMGQRLEATQSRLDEQTSRASKMASDLDAAQKALQAFAQKEAAIAGALVSTEQRRAVVEAELAAARDAAVKQAEELVQDAQRQADEVLGAARQRAESVSADAEAARVRAEDQLQALCSQYDDTVSRIRRTLEAHLTMLPSPTNTIGGMTVAAIAQVNDTVRTAQAA